VIYDNRALALALGVVIDDKSWQLWYNYYLVHRYRLVISDSAKYKLVIGFHYNLLYQINIRFNYQYLNTVSADHMTEDYIT